jgi:hypothetical protein
LWFGLLRWFFCLLGPIGPSILFLLFLFFGGVLWFIYDWQGFITLKANMKQTRCQIL